MASLAGCIPAGRGPAPADSGGTYTEPTIGRPAPRPDRPGPDRRPRPDRGPASDDKVEQLPAPRPAWEARRVTADAAEVPDQSYTVRPGDSLRAIAARTGAGSEAIARANTLAPPFTIQAGQRLRIPGGRYHLVRAGETGIAIARAYGVEWSQIVSANDLAEPYILRTGMRVLIPGADRPRSAADRAAAFSLDVDDIMTGGEPALAANKAPARPVASTRRVLPATAAVAPPAAAPGRFAWPIDGKVVKRFGKGGTGDRSDGIEIAAPVDTPIRASADGTVAYVGDSIAALGGLVIVKHGGGWTSIYGHASSLKVQRGQAVKRGQVIALSGDTGFSDRPQLHFELRRGRDPVDPMSELPRR
jgi:lipoprotein NlpD